MTGRYIALEGPEGCGKSTHAARLAAALGAVATRETGGTAVGQQLRTILHDPSTISLDARAEALMVAADRAQHLAQVVRPALERGDVVVSDRSVYSSLAYQGYGRGLDLDELKWLNDWAAGGLWPSLVVLLAVDPGEQHRRLAGRDLDRFEQEDAEFHQRVIDGYREMAEADRDRWIVFDARDDIDVVASRVLEAVRHRLGRGPS